MTRLCTRNHAVTVALRLLLAPVVIGTCASRADASPPRDPLTIPLFTFDLDSPSVMPGGPIAGDTILKKVPNIPNAQPEIAGSILGLGLPGDEVDAMSFNRAGLLMTDRFVLLFSVDRFTTGDVPTNPLLREQEVPFTVFDQQLRGHAAGDGFITLQLFNRFGALPSLRGTPKSNTQTENNYDEGGSDFGADPPTSSRDDVPAASEDDVDGMSSPSSITQPFAPEGPGTIGLFLSLTRESPSGGDQGRGGADVIFAPDVFDGNGQGGGFNFAGPNPSPIVFANASSLGLQPFDEIDALVVIDGNSAGVFDAGDQVIFSLAPGSPSLTVAPTLPNVSSNGAADIFSIRVLSDGAHLTELFAPAAELGLVGPTDNVDALELVICTTTAMDCARLSGIRLIRGDWDNDGEITLTDLPGLKMCFSGPFQKPGFSPPSQICRDVFDFEPDGDVDLRDFERFARRFNQTIP